MHWSGELITRRRGGSAARRARRSYLGRLALTILLAESTACGNLVGVESSPSRVDAADVETPANAALLVDGAAANFNCAFADYITGAGLVSGELQWASTSPWGREYDQRAFNSASGFYATQTCDTGLGIYKPLATARWQADNTLKLLQGWTDQQVTGRQALIARAAAYSGYAHVLLGEGMCSAAFDLGPEQTPAQILARAEDRFTQALAAARTAQLSDVTNLALVGRARARLDLGKKAEAAADAQLVTDGFVFNATYSAARFRSYDFIYSNVNRDEGVVVGAPFRAVAYNGTADPRVAVQNLGRTAADRTTPLWVQTKYGSLAAPVPIATWREALLISAEAQLGQAAVAAINKLHARVGLPPFASTNDTQIMQQIIYERRAELFLESHALGDVRRLSLPLAPAAGTPYPAGGTYGNQSCFPLPDNERLNNPNLS
ncbi:MAG TPA: RagB/SusD family nutrient uptake outer membrane protein [Candidatus Elarobacter sp.]|nr:RagB/SusD family nutrient uptake outer membrane protein [Candidatus Elarobacter sp.]